MHKYSYCSLFVCLCMSMCVSVCDKLNQSGKPPLNSKGFQLADFSNHEANSLLQRMFLQNNVVVM